MAHDAGSEGHERQSIVQVDGTARLAPRRSIKEGAAVAREEFSDLLAEVKAERERESAESAPSTKDGV